MRPFLASKVTCDMLRRTGLSDLHIPYGPNKKPITPRAVGLRERYNLYIFQHREKAMQRLVTKYDKATDSTTQLNVESKIVNQRMKLQSSVEKVYRPQGAVTKAVLEKLRESGWDTQYKTNNMGYDKNAIRQIKTKHAETSRVVRQVLENANTIDSCGGGMGRGIVDTLVKTTSWRKIQLDSEILIQKSARSSSEPVLHQRSLLSRLFRRGETLITTNTPWFMDSDGRGTSISSDTESQYSVDLQASPVLNLRSSSVTDFVASASASDSPETPHTASISCENSYENLPATGANDSTVDGVVQLTNTQSDDLRSTVLSLDDNQEQPKARSRNPLLAQTTDYTLYARVDKSKKTTSVNTPDQVDGMLRVNNCPSEEEDELAPLPPTRTISMLDNLKGRSSRRRDIGGSIDTQVIYTEVKFTSGMRAPVKPARPNLKARINGQQVSDSNSTYAIIRPKTQQKPTIPPKPRTALLTKPPVFPKPTVRR